MRRMLRSGGLFNPGTLTGRSKCCRGGGSKEHSTGDGSSHWAIRMTCGSDAAKDGSPTVREFFCMACWDDARVPGVEVRKREVQRSRRTTWLRSGDSTAKLG